MPGFSTITGDESIMFADNCSFDGTKRDGKMTTDGQLWIGSTALPRVRRGTFTSPDGSLTIGYSAPNITAIVNRSIITDLHTARFIVSANGAADGANYTTIQAAINAAQGTGINQTVFIQPGTYNENLTIRPGINLAAYTCDAATPNVTINGTCTYTEAGIVSMSGINFKTNSAFAIVVSGSAASQFMLNNCNIQCSNNTGISFTSSNGGAAIICNYCTGNLETTGIAVFASSASAGIAFRWCSFTNSGASTTANTTSVSSAFMVYSLFSNPFSCSSTGTLGFTYTGVNTSAQNATCVTTAGTGTSSANYSSFVSGSASSISVGSGTNMSCSGQINVDSTNTNAITGAGTFRGGVVQFTNSSSGVDVTSQSPFTVIGGGWSLIRTLTASTSTSLDFTTLPTYPVYAIVLNNLRPATNAQQLTLRVSNDNGSSFAATGYTAGINYTSYNSATVTNVNSTTAATLSSNANNGVGISGIVYVSTGNGYYWGTTSYLSTDSTVNAFGTCGGSTGLQPNAFRLIMTTGNLTSGTATIYGLKAS